MKTLAELKEIERQLEKSLETVRESMREHINRDNLNRKKNKFNVYKFYSGTGL